MNLSTLLRIALILTSIVSLLACSKTTSPTNSSDNSIHNKNIFGVSQKGPFVKGSTVRLYELDRNTKAQTGKTFIGKIKNDQGYFEVSNINMESPYAIVEAEGFYKNEITGKKSQIPITLKAIVDLTNREQVNVNVLTHLEYEYVKNRFEVYENVTLTDLKRKALQGILHIFGFNNQSIENSEDLEITGDSEGSQMLLALSVLLLEDLNEADFTERLDCISDTIGYMYHEDFGKYNANEYDDIRKRIAACNVKDKPPEWMTGDIANEMEFWAMEASNIAVSAHHDFEWFSTKLDGIRNNVNHESFDKKGETSTTSSVDEHFDFRMYIEKIGRKILGECNSFKEGRVLQYRPYRNLEENPCDTVANKGDSNRDCLALMKFNDTQRGFYICKNNEWKPLSDNLEKYSCYYGTKYKYDSDSIKVLDRDTLVIQYNEQNNILIPHDTLLYYHEYEEEWEKPLLPYGTEKLLRICIEKKKLKK